jgi:hypothetical protein
MTFMTRWLPKMLSAVPRHAPTKGMGVVVASLFPNHLEHAAE